MLYCPQQFRNKPVSFQTDVRHVLLLYMVVSHLCETHRCGQNCPCGRRYYPSIHPSSYLSIPKVNKGKKRKKTTEATWQLEFGQLPDMQGKKNNNLPTSFLSSHSSLDNQSLQKSLQLCLQQHAITSHPSPQLSHLHRLPLFTYLHLGPSPAPTPSHGSPAGQPLNVSSLLFPLGWWLGEQGPRSLLLALHRL